MTRQTKIGPIATPIETLIFGLMSIVLLFGLAAPGWAQSHGATLRTPARVHMRTSHVAATVGTPLNPNFTPIHGVPGLGFDYAHLAAIQQPIRGNRGPRPIAQPVFGAVLPAFYDLPGNDSQYYDAESQPAAVAEQQPPPTFIIQYQSPPEDPAESAPAPVNVDAAPPPELGQLILARRDGRLLLALAFTTAGDRLTYITPEGLRRSMVLADLDVNATRQLNEDNGTTVALPN